MTIEDLIVYGKKYTNSKFVYLILSNLLKIDTLDLLNHLQDVIDENKVNKFKKSIDLLVQNKPIQYVLGNVNFYGIDYDINDKVLIPRFETEELVENTLKYIDRLFNNKVKVIDLGCGSGVIGLTLKIKNNNLDVTLLDISEDALLVANHNKEKNNVDVKIIKGNMLNNINDKFDVIISNPPYIKTDEQIEDIVKNNEPHIALYGGIDGLYYYDLILSNAKRCLNDKYLIAFEIGCTQKNDIIDLSHKYLNDCKIDCLKDLSGKDRMIFIYNV